ncbi:MAPEG family protein [Pseudooceanicola sp. CBS1P-1]|uniref:MAPEG family protein n=1 Tax=Pseudooceanicola albus TaxID=2692189 RepID=A0A6L7G3U6_9RHOB|nr:MULTISPECIES: MAPEG family protein [Pseudooceanicola]MBT9384818.1 MAPEG family protein [Pseudooceanicola endophyticus]MXN18188.1 MAPEG family protein [Pseudooceanicola albus]
MDTQLHILALAGLLQVLQIALMAIPANLELGPKATTGPRDPQDIPGGNPQLLMSRRTGRLHRAMTNHFEALILFTIATLAVTLTTSTSPLTLACGWLYLAARLLYIPAYALAWTPWRSLFWALGLLATTIMLLAALA